ncbi:MAG: cation:proton antiporter [Candidatus Altiarchaeales archaeon]|nr:cation:proton antiporter [Candidatus Altiarchaeota archaeon]MBU4406760.1 cation:proton antiporter [Candidatus Altiarchaeota archaeon]MCG2782345.1 cation:proton antiporter [Candidatus Altiarchaeales archaeon]
MEISFIANLLTVLLAAGIGRGLSRWLKQPIVLGEIVLGMLLGNFGLIVITETLSNLADLGVLFLLFSAGFAINLEEFKRVCRCSLVATLTDVVISFTLGYLTARLFGFPELTSMFVGAALTATSVGIQTSLLREFNVLRTRIGTFILGVAIGDDVAGILIITILGSVVSLGGVTLEGIALIIIFAAAFFLFSLTVGVRIMKKLSRGRVMMRESLLLLSLIIILAFGITAKEMGLEVIIGAFVAGLVLGQSYFARGIIEEISIFGDAFFVPIFFIIMGAGFDLAHLSVGYFTVALIVVAILSKIIGCGIGARFAGFNFRQSLAVGTAMIPRAEVCLIIASVGLRYGIISQEIASSILAMIIVIAIITPPLLGIMLRWMNSGPRTTQLI